MEKRKVTVVLFSGEDGGYAAFMPLFPSCTTEGYTVEEALKNAKESLELALDESVGPAGPRRGRGGATRLFEAKGRGTSVAEGSDPRADGVGIPFQRLGYRRRSPALGQKPESMPPFPLPRCWRSIHAFSQVTYIQLPPFKKFHYVPHTQHHRHSTSLTEYRNSSAGLALCSFHLGISLVKAPSADEYGSTPESTCLAANLRDRYPLTPDSSNPKQKSQTFTSPASYGPLNGWIVEGRIGFRDIRSPSEPGAR